MSSGGPIERRGKKPPAGDPVLERAFRLLAVFNVEEQSLSLTELSGRTAIPLSTTLRLAKQLVSVGALERNEDSTYSIGLRLLEAAALAPRGHGLRGMAMPFMEDLHHATKEHVLLAVRDSTDAVIIERLSSRSAGRILYRIGERVPLHSTGVGLVLLAHSAVELQEQILATPLTLQPEGVEMAAGTLRKQLAAIRQEGTASNTRPLPEPAASIAVPIFGPGRKVIAALSIVVTSNAEDLQSYRPAIVAVGRAISREAMTVRMRPAYAPT